MAQKRTLDLLKESFDLSKRRKFDVKDDNGNVVVSLYFKAITRADRARATQRAGSDDPLVVSTHMLCQLAEKEDGTKDFTKVTEYMIQEGTASIDEDHNGNQVYQENYNQINRYDGTTQNDNSTTYHNNGMLTTEYEKDGVDYLYVTNGNHSASKVFSSEDDFTNAVESKYAVLGENGFVSDWDDGSNVDTSDPLYRDFNNKLDPFMAELLAEINDPSAVGEVDGVDGTEEIDDNEDGELSTESSSVVDTELLDQGLIDENGNPIEQDTTNTVANNTETNNNPDETGDINQSDDSTDDEIQNQQNLPNTTDE